MWCAKFRGLLWQNPLATAWPTSSWGLETLVSLSSLQAVVDKFSWQQLRGKDMLRNILLDKSFMLHAQANLELPADVPANALLSNWGS